MFLHLSLRSSIEDLYFWEDIRFDFLESRSRRGSVSFIFIILYTHPLYLSVLKFYVGQIIAKVCSLCLFNKFIFVLLIGHIFMYVCSCLIFVYLGPLFVFFIFSECFLNELLQCLFRLFIICHLNSSISCSDGYKDCLCFCFFFIYLS